MPVRAPRWDPDWGLLRTSAVAMAAVFATFFTAWLIEDLAHLHTDVVVLGVVLALSLGRVEGASHRTRQTGGHVEQLRTVVIVALLAATASTIGTLMLQHAALGDALFTLAIAAGIWLRRYGRAGRLVGTLIALPFIALLVAPSAPGYGAAHTGWTAVIAIVALGYVSGFGLLGRRLGWISAPAPRAEAFSRPSAARIPASTRMAAQMAVGLGAAFLVGHQLFPAHWPWVVLTAYITASGNRGRGDVVYKGALRLIGAGAGTIAATALASAFERGERWAIVAIFAIVSLVHWLRSWNYAFWAAGVTAALALLYGYDGVSGLSLLGDRLEAIAVGAVIAVLAAWLVLPIPTTQVLKRRVADTLAVYSDLLTTARRRDHEALTRECARLHATAAGVDQLAPAITAHRLVTRWAWPGPHPADAIAGIRTLRGQADRLGHRVQADPALLDDPGLAAELAHLQGTLTATRRRLGRRPAESGAAAVPDPGDGHGSHELREALEQIASAFETSRTPPR